MSPKSTGPQIAFLAALLTALGVLALFVPAPKAQTSNPSIGFNRCLAVTTSDTVDLAPFSQNQMLTGIIYVGGAGNVTAVMQDGSTVLFTAPPVGALLPIAVRRINATGTTATALVACYRQ